MSRKTPREKLVSCFLENLEEHRYELSLEKMEEFLKYVFDDQDSFAEVINFKDGDTADYGRRISRITESTDFESKEQYKDFLNLKDGAATLLQEAKALKALSVSACGQTIFAEMARADAVAGSDGNNKVIPSSRPAI